MVIGKILRKIDQLYFQLSLSVRHRLYGLKTVYLYLSNSSGERVKYILEKFGANISDSVSFAGPIVVENAHDKGDFSHLSIGKNTYGRNVFFDLTGSIKISSFCAISANVNFITHADPGERPLRQFFKRKVAPIHVGKGSWIGANCIILPGVSIGECSVIGAGTVVTKDVAAHTLIYNKLNIERKILK